MHPRLTVSQVSSWSWSLDDDLEFYRRAGINRVGAHLRKLEATGDAEAAAKRMVDAGLEVTSLLAASPFHLDDPSSFLDAAYALGQALDLARLLGTPMVVITSGPAGQLSWERAADSLEEALRPTLREAEREGLEILLEFTNPLRTDISFVHTLRDAMELAWRLDTRVCLEITACWYERNLAGNIASGIDAIGLVQVSDTAVGTLDTPNRLVPGDGDIPITRILRHLLDAGYSGYLEIELVGPRIDEEGYESAIGRSIDWLGEQLDELGAGPPSTDRVP
jgi:sugar phosphate isomerase/epimerase